MELTTEQRTELLKRIDQILWNDWDPIGINDYGGPEDEYDDYSPEILELLIENAGTEEIAKKLLSFESEWIEVFTNDVHRLKVARKIKTDYEEFFQIEFKNKLLKAHNRGKK